jgi:hypothetical protein
VTAAEMLAATFRSNWARYNQIEGVQSPTWLVPINDPEALRTALEQTPAARSVQNHLPSGATFVFKA